MSKDKFEIMTSAIVDYMNEQGWKIIVIGSLRVVKRPTPKKYCYDLVFDIIAKKTEKEKDV